MLDKSHLRSVPVDATLGVRELAARIDHTLLKPDATRDQIEKLCQEALDAGFASVCVNGVWTAVVSEHLQDSDVLTCTVVGFPLGAAATAVKVYEAQQAMADGAQEIDMVINIAAARDGDRAALESDIRAVSDAVHASDGLLKVIIETCLLTDDQKVLACQAAVAAGADYVKTSTGFSTGSATVQDVALMRRTVGEEIGVKASGGIRTHQSAVEMIRAGASRIGASAGVALLDESTQAGHGSGAQTY